MSDGSAQCLGMTGTQVTLRRDERASAEHRSHRRPAPPSPPRIPWAATTRTQRRGTLLGRQVPPTNPAARVMRLADPDVSAREHRTGVGHHRSLDPHNHRRSAWLTDGRSGWRRTRAAISDVTEYRLAAAGQAITSTDSNAMIGYWSMS